MSIIDAQSFSELSQISTQNLKIEKLFGEASNRQYFRLKDDQGSTYILMQMPEGASSASEEAMSKEVKVQELPFLNIQRFLHEQGVSVPQVLGYASDQKQIILSDLGNETLENLVKKSTTDLKLFFYKKAIDALVVFQKSFSKPNSDCLIFHRQFDLKLLEWEFEHFLEYGIEDRFQIKIPSTERESMLQFGKELCQAIESSPYEVTHRDFQSRNLMLHGYEFYLIDFQDALLGPLAYDLVALLRDSYIELSEDDRNLLTDYFLSSRKKAELACPEKQAFMKQFHLVTLHRKLKDTGRFQYIHTVKGNSKFLEHVPLSLKYINEAFEKLPEFHQLKELFAHYVPELQD